MNADKLSAGPELPVNSASDADIRPVAADNRVVVTSIQLATTNNRVVIGAVEPEISGNDGWKPVIASGARVNRPVSSSIDPKFPFSGKAGLGIPAVRGSKAVQVGVDLSISIPY